MASWRTLENLTPWHALGDAMGCTGDTCIHDIYNGIFQWVQFVHGVPYGAHRKVPWVDPGVNRDASSCSGFCGRYRIPTTAVERRDTCPG